ncbi:hemagglutinin/amebocyte aggregation factor-like [Dendronephthya gigantea]|uniref:hemagglutinin/amebocyte aggregation factor-like n=1 Tax=Dendronephthya gigantea TaxID=151771 RepID=UPI00106914D2|nr:hemagglutinin/amebocyte aggregation factor-like [Dendronephthya gigantea]
MMQFMFAALVFLAHAMSINAGTNFYWTWKLDCPSGQSVRHISSVHSNYHEDRSWTFTCRSDPVTQSTCSWSGWVNLFGEMILYQCKDGVIAGVQSYHNKYHKDRRYSFKCCKAKSYTRICTWTGFVNNWDGYVTYGVRHNYYLVGLFSYHSKGHGDRRWRFLTC